MPNIGTQSRRSPFLKTIRLTVTQSDIQDGQPGHPEQCPIALAFSRRFGLEVSVDGERVFIDTGDDMPGVQYKTPDEASDFIRLFDAHKPVMPTCFVFMRTV